MHLFASQPGGFVDGEGIVDLEQEPADIIILSAADSSLSALARAVDSLPENFASVRLANWMHLTKPAAFDLYQETVLQHCQLVVVSLLGGASYWQYGFEQLKLWAQKKNKTIIFVPGDDSPDEILFSACTVSEQQSKQVWRYLRESGEFNSKQLFYYLADQFLQGNLSFQDPQALPQCLIYEPGTRVNGSVSVSEWQADLKNPEWPVCLLLFYRSHLQSANTTMFDDLIGCLMQQDMNVLLMAVASLKDENCLLVINDVIEKSDAALILNTTGFSSNKVANAHLSSLPTILKSPFARDLPVLQLILSSTTQEDWTETTQGLRSRDIAMHVVLPEMDGRIITRAISFKTQSHYSERCQTSVVRYSLHTERAHFVSALAKRYCILSRKKNCDKRIALILANYPTKDGRIGNGVGLDTPASTVNILQALQQAHYPAVASC